MKPFIGIFLGLLLCSCGAVKVSYDYDKDTDFNNYSTYNYFSDLDTGLSELDTKRLLRIVDSTMRIKGFLLTEDPDIYINIQSSDYSAPSRNNLGIGIGGGGRSIGGGVSVGVPVGQPNISRELVFDFVDSQKNLLFWQGIGRSTIKPNAAPHIREEKLRKIVGKVFSKYPGNQE